jgi:hypothetical protein
VQALEMRIAEHEAVFRVPQHEGFRDGLDGVAQPQIASTVFSARLFCSVMSTAMPIRCRPLSAAPG